jgi:hypothetical protein
LLINPIANPNPVTRDNMDVAFVMNLIEEQIFTIIVVNLKIHSLVVPNFGSYYITVKRWSNYVYVFFSVCTLDKSLSREFHVCPEDLLTASFVLGLIQLNFYSFAYLKIASTVSLIYLIIHSGVPSHNYI